MLSAAMLAMVLAAAVPALAQSVTQVGDDNIACVQTAVQNEVNKTQITQFGDNINIQNISQECNINVTEVENIVNQIGVTTTGGTTTTTTTISGAAPSVQYQFGAAPQLPPPGGSSLIALGVGVLLVVRGLLARRIVR